MVVYIRWTGGLEWTGLDWTGLDWWACNFNNYFKIACEDTHLYLKEEHVCWSSLGVLTHIHLDTNKNKKKKKQIKIN